MTRLDLNLDHFVTRVLQDAFTEATAIYWTRRSMDFLNARSRPGDWPGGSTPEDIAAMDSRLTGLANACRARASLAPLQDNEIDDAVVDVLTEVAS